jgi:hypothetical protein
VLLPGSSPSPLPHSERNLRRTALPLPRASLAEKTPGKPRDEFCALYLQLHTHTHASTHASSGLQGLDLSRDSGSTLLKGAMEMAGGVSRNPARVEGDVCVLRPWECSRFLTLTMRDLLLYLDRKFLDL